jgi:hypothetical protein
VLNSLNRREFTRTLLVGVGGAVLPGPGSAQTRKLNIGCTSLVWGALPRSPENLEAALKEMHALGYHKAETFAAMR